MPYCLCAVASKVGSSTKEIKIKQRAKQRVAMPKAKSKTNKPGGSHDESPPSRRRSLRSAEAAEGSSPPMVRQPEGGPQPAGRRRPEVRDVEVHDFIRLLFDGGRIAKFIRLISAPPSSEEPVSEDDSKYVRDFLSRLCCKSMRSSLGTWTI